MIQIDNMWIFTRIYFSYVHTQQYVFHKRPIPDDEEGKQELCHKLQKFDVSIAAYDAALSEEPVYMYGMLA